MYIAEVETTWLLSYVMITYNMLNLEGNDSVYNVMRPTCDRDDM